MTDTPAPHEGATPRLRDAIADKLKRRANWLKAEYLTGGDFLRLREREDECRYLASALFDDPSVIAAVNAYDPEREGKVKALVEALKIIEAGEGEERAIRNAAGGFEDALPQPLSARAALKAMGE